MAPEQRLYVYAIVPADVPDPPAELVGVDGGPLHLLRSGDLAAVLSPLPAAEYAEEVLSERLGDVAWVGERGLTHERVLDWLAEQGPVIPLSLFSLQDSEAAVRERLEAGADRFKEVLEGLRGRREWRVKLWRRDEELLKHLDELFPLLGALRQGIEQAPAERRGALLERYRSAQTEELQTLSRRAAHQVLARLRERAERALPTTAPSSTSEGERTALLEVALLVKDGELKAFQQRVGELARELGGVGFEFELTGPWPPYHFTEPDEQGER